MNTTPDAPDSQARITALAQGLQEAGWAIGRNLRIDTRWSSGNRARLRKEAADLVALGPDVIVAGVGPTTLVLQQVSHTVPIEMAQAVDPVGSGFIKSMARPGTNATGFTQFEFGLAAKWLELRRAKFGHRLFHGLLSPPALGKGERSHSWPRSGLSSAVVWATHGRVVVTAAAALRGLIEQRRRLHQQAIAA